MKDRIAIRNDIGFIRYLKTHGGDTMKKCFQCATCSVVCSLSPQDSSFPRKEMIQAGWGLKDSLVSDPDIWLCHGCMDCSEHCPRGAKPADLMAALRNYIYRHFAFPGFMGKALNSPKYLFLLFFIPLLFISGLVAASHAGNLFGFLPLPDGEFRYRDFVAHGPLEMLFIAGNILIFSFAFIGFRKYWFNMASYAHGRVQKTFIRSAFEVVQELMLHRKFDKCNANSNRRWGHLFVFYGYIGCLVATGIVVLDVFNIFGKFLPEDMNLPVYLLGNFNIKSSHDLVEIAGLFTKVFGMFSGILIVLGGLLLILKRYYTPANEGKSTYNDMLFLWVLWGVAFTGMLCVVFRLTHAAFLGYPTYYIHLILVFFLLWYMPYSKFAHMIYRFLGLIFLRMYGRNNKAEIFQN